MGNAAVHGRRALVATAKQAVERANECIVGLAELQEKHNYLANQTADDVAGHAKRMDGLGAWCAQTEKAVDRESTRLTRTRVELGQIELEFLTFTLMTFWQRLRWLVTGCWDRPARESEARPTHEATALTERGHTALADARRAMGEAIPHTSLGPRVLP